MDWEALAAANAEMPDGKRWPMPSAHWHSCATPTIDCAAFVHSSNGEGITLASVSYGILECEAGNVLSDQVAARFGQEGVMLALSKVDDHRGWRAPTDVEARRALADFGLEHAREIPEAATDRSRAWFEVRA